MEQFVYFLLDEQVGQLKIGKSAAPLARWQTLQSGHPRPLRGLFCLRGEEKDYHGRFAALRVDGEWFRYEGRLREFCEGIAALTIVCPRCCAALAGTDSPCAVCAERRANPRETRLVHPRRTEAEALIREGKLRRWQIAEKCEASKETVSRWAREMGVRIRGTGRIRRKEGAR